MAGVLLMLSLIGDGSLYGAEPSNAQAISGTWVLQQASSTAELERLRNTVVVPAVSTQHIRGFCLRVPWKSIDKDFSLLEAGLRIAHQHDVAYSVRFMAGRHTPERVFHKGCRFYLRGGRGREGQAGAEKVPVPFLQDGSPNIIFETEYERFVVRLAGWCRSKGVRLLHLAWYGQDWAELNHGKEVRALAGYSFENWLQAHTRLIDIGLKHAGDDLAVELPFSGYGPLTEAASLFADHIVSRIGPHDQRFFCQANGWGPNGDWGAPSAQTEAAFDRVWTKPIRRGQQAIQPSDFDWSRMYEKLYHNNATYCEIYAPSFSRNRKAQLATQIKRFVEHCQACVSFKPHQTENSKLPRMAVQEAGPHQAGGDNLPSPNPGLSAGVNLAAASGRERTALILAPDTVLLRFGSEASRNRAQITSMPMAECQDIASLRRYYHPMLR